MTTCTTCNGTKVVPVFICGEEQIRTCLDCMKVKARQEGPQEETGLLLPNGMPEVGTPEQYRLGIKRGYWLLGW
jgi:hypothetical protein